MDPRRRHELTRYGAPAAFLVAVTIAVVLIKAGLNGAPNAEPALIGTARTATAAKAPTTTKLVLSTPPTTTAETTTPGAVYYLVQSGDTLGSIAQKYNTTVEELLTLNQGVDPTALHVGQRIRVQ